MQSTVHCTGGITRVVWSGDNILWEMRGPGADSVPAARLNEVSATAAEFGIVGYTHAGGVDRPLLVWKGAMVVVPHTNWRGVFGKGTNSSGGTSTVAIEWPGFISNAFHAIMTNPTPTSNWMGSLIGGHRDAGGRMYMRNRYYDPATGQFTQTDPIGVSGGINTYGFAAGDPITYRDPFGLAVCFQGTRSEIRSLVRQVEQVVQGRVRLGIDNCVTGVELRNENEHGTEFQQLVEADFVYTIRVGPVSNFLNGVLQLNLDQAGVAYFAFDGDECVKTGTATLPQITAHELGHAYRHRRRGGGSRLRLRVHVMPDGKGNRRVRRVFCDLLGEHVPGGFGTSPAVPVRRNVLGRMNTRFAVLLLSISLGACSPLNSTPQPRLPTGSRSSAECPTPTEVGSNWPRVRARYGGFTFRVPPSAERSHIQREGIAIGENWRGPDGLEISYRVYRERGSERRVRDGDLAFQCVAWLGNVRAELVGFYSSDSYVPGQYVVAQWDTEDDKRVVLTVISPDPLQTDLLMVIALSADAGP